METVRISGSVTDGDGQPVVGALVRFVAGIDTLGAVPEAVVSAPTAVVWTQPVTGYAGKLWHAYRKFVAGEVAGLSYAEFKLQVVEHNPSLAGDEFVFRHDQVYRMPANDSPTLETSWDRTLTGFRGTVRACWRTFVAGKVIGMPWHAFKGAMAEHNPGLGRDGILLPDRTYRLPHHSFFVEYQPRRGQEDQGVGRRVSHGDHRHAVQPPGLDGKPARPGAQTLRNG